MQDESVKRVCCREPISCDTVALMPKRKKSYRPERIVIIGAGPCGLGAGWRLRELGIDGHIFEASDHPGGLASSYLDANGFTWDIGGHVLHSHYPYFDRMFEDVMRGEYLTHERESWVWMCDRFVPYPFQNNIHRLPPRVRDECLCGLYEVAKYDATHLHSFADWIIRSFGRGIAKHFLFPYNEKVWAIPPKQMNYVWVGDRVATVDVTRIEENIRLSRDDVSWGPNATFQFPRNGGTGNIWKRVADRLSDAVSYQKEVTRIDAKAHRIVFADGTSETYDALLSTMPIDVLGKTLSDILIPQPMPLVYSRVSVVGMGIRGQVPDSLRTKCWIYFPESKAPFFRATVFSNYSPNNAPKGTWSLMTETASSDFRELPGDDMTDLCIEGAIATKLISSRKNIVDTWEYTTGHGYPTPTIGRDAYLAKALPHLEKYDIYSRGRFGAWKYEVGNQDHVFMQGVEWVNRMIENSEEQTIFHPEIVNRRG